MSKREPLYFKGIRVDGDDEIETSASRVSVRDAKPTGEVSKEARHGAVAGAVAKAKPVTLNAAEIYARWNAKKDG